jgi:hypothetical protein
VEQSLEGSVATPLLETAMAGLVRRIAFRKVVPRSAGAQDPENPVQHFARVSPRPAATIPAASRHRDQRCDDLPLRVRQVQCVPLQGEGSVVCYERARERSPAARYTGSLPLTLTYSTQAENAFLAMLSDPLGEDFSGFGSGDEDPLDLSFGTLTDPSSARAGFVATALSAQSGFPITGPTYWKNTTEEGEGLFAIAFDAPVRALGFYATAYSTLARTGSTSLALRLSLEAGGTLDLTISHAQVDGDGRAFYFGVIADPFTSATLFNFGNDDGDVIGFDDFTAACNAVPEPSTGLLLAGGLGALAAARRSGHRRSRG